MPKRDLRKGLVLYDFPIEKHSAGFIIEESHHFKGFGLEQSLAILEIAGHLPILLYDLQQKKE